MGTLMAMSQEFSPTRVGMNGKEQPSGLETPMAVPQPSNVTLLCLLRTAANLHGGSALALSHLSDHGFVL